MLHLRYGKEAAPTGAGGFTWLNGKHRGLNFQLDTREVFGLSLSPLSLTQLSTCAVHWYYPLALSTERQTLNQESS
jgi:hypothetical protein